jgi:hypothetical protein
MREGGRVKVKERLDIAGDSCVESTLLFVVQEIVPCKYLQQDLGVRSVAK